MTNTPHLVFVHGTYCLRPMIRLWSSPPIVFTVIAVSEEESYLSTHSSTEGTSMSWDQHVPQDIIAKYQVCDFHHAAAILKHEFPAEFEDICTVLRAFTISVDDIVKPGGNESAIPKKFRQVMGPLGWTEDQLTADVIVGGVHIRTHTHKIDFLKGRVALDFEWNSKDQTFDRDLYAFSGFFEYDRISVGVLVTRSDELEELFETLGGMVKKKYGASTTHMGKLLPRLADWRHRGCPILVFGIKREVVADAPKRRVKKQRKTPKTDKVQ